MKTMMTTVIALFAFSAIAQPEPIIDCATIQLDQGGCLREPSTIVYGYSGDVRNIMWVPALEDVPRRAQLFYQLELYTWPQGIRVSAFTTAMGVESQAWTPASSGNYWARVAACDSTMAPEEACSTWASSRDPLYTNGVPWIMVIAIKPPTGGGID